MGEFTSELREFVPFAIKLAVISSLRLIAAPIVGAVRATWKEWERVYAELDAWNAKQRAQQK